MQNLDKLERRFGHIAIPNLTLVLVAGQSLCFILYAIDPGFIRELVLVPHLVLKGEIWRLITFIIVPPQTNPIFAFFALYIFYMMGTALEEEWGLFKYNVYMAVAFFATVIITILGPVYVADNFYIEASVFLAFAFLYPDFEFLLFFVLPVKVKYLSWFTWFIYAFQIVAGNISQRCLIVASLCNYFLFFGKDIIESIRSQQRRKEFESKQVELTERVLHRCEKCGCTEKTDINIEFRVCSKCTEGQEYCLDHIGEHEHI